MKVWNPKDPEYSIQEESMVDFRGEIKEQKQRSFVILAVLERCCDPHLFCEDVLSMVISVVGQKMVESHSSQVNYQRSGISLRKWLERPSKLQQGCAQETLLTSH